MTHTKRTDNQLSTRDHIKQTFLSLYEHKPLHRIFVSDLVNSCNISRGTFYFYYDNIGQVYHEWELDLINIMEDGLDKVVLYTVGSSRKEMDRFVQIYSKHISRYPKYLYLYHCMLKGSERASFQQEWTNSVRRHFEQTLNLSKTVSSSERELLLEFYSGGTVAMLSNWVLNNCKIPPEEIATITAQVQFQGAFLSDDSKF